MFSSAVSASYLEIYNEELSDLLAPASSNQALTLMESGDSRGVICAGAAGRTLAVGVGLTAAGAGFALCFAGAALPRIMSAHVFFAG